MPYLLACGEIGHRHHLDHHTSPAGEMLRTLPLAGLRVVLFPGESCSFPFPEDVLHHILSQVRIQLTGLLLVGASRGCNILV